MTRIVSPFATTPTTRNEKIIVAETMMLESENGL